MLGNTLIQVTASVSPGTSNVQILGITAVGIQTTSGPLANPWYAYIDPGVSSFSSLSPYSIFMAYPAGYSPADTTVPSVPDLISAPTPVTLADGNTTLWTFDPSSAVTSALLQVDGFPDSAEPTSQTNVLSPSDYLSQTPLPTIASTTGNGLKSVTANNIAVVIKVMSQGTPMAVSLGGLTLAGGLVACPNAEPTDATCLPGATLTNQPPPVVISSLNFSQLARLDDLPISTTQLTYTPTVEPSDPSTAPTCAQFLAQGPTSLARYVQYQYTPTTNQTVNIDTGGSHFDTVLLMTSSNDSSFTPACADDEDNGAVLQAALPLEPLQSGKTYTITAGEYPSFREYECNSSADCSAGSPFPSGVVNSPLSPDPVLQFAMTIQPEGTSTSVSCTPANR
jgi:hypothetical protein